MNKFKEFTKELVKLCKKHDVVLTTSLYDSLQVWDKDDWEEILPRGIEDKTDEQ